MKRFFLNNIPVLALILLMLCSSRTAEAQAKNPQRDSLYQQIMSLDSLLFDALNRRDSLTFDRLFSADLEFFHDQGGLTGYKETTGFLRSLVQSGSDLQRSLVPGTSEVYPVPGYGAMQMGNHEFCHTEGGRQVCGTFHFVHIWKNSDGVWTITRVVSYGH